jgi:energy-coupling factor transporter ATP-binding protein EcfA2
MNILVGPNNAGKSTVLQSFRVLEATLRRARLRAPEPVDSPNGDAFGYYFSDQNLPMSLENIHADLSDEDTTVSFLLSNGNTVQLYFPVDGGCALIPLATAVAIRSPAAFKAEFPISIVTVPTLGQVEHREQLVKPTTVQRNVETHLAPRHFRNYWYYKCWDHDGSFDEFSALVSKTWPGVEIRQPTLTGISPELSMHVLERRMTRELYWAGSGFQVWCQLLTHVGRSDDASIFIIDEPDIYLHADLQRQLLSMLRMVSADVLLATHSSEIIGEADPTEIVLIDKKLDTGARLHSVAGVQDVLDGIGSVQNITLTSLARNKTILFVEGDKDYSILRAFAKRLDFAEIASGTALTHVRSGGLSSWRRIRDLGWSLQQALTKGLAIGTVYDRDYFAAEEIASILGELRSHIDYAHIHSRKEIENYLLVPAVLQRAVAVAVTERERRSRTLKEVPSIPTLLEDITASMKTSVKAQYHGRRADYLGRSKVDSSTIFLETDAWFEARWQALNTRMEIVPGKEVLARLRESLQTTHGLTLTDYDIVAAFEPSEIPPDLSSLLSELDSFRKRR